MNDFDLYTQIPPLLLMVETDEHCNITNLHHLLHLLMTSSAGVYALTMILDNG